MRYAVRKSIIHVIGRIWMPAATAAMTYTLRSYDIENMRDEDGSITRESVDNWLAMNAGDFQGVTDFYASIEDGNKSIDLPWADEDSELTFNDCMFPEDE
jgi:hypothetical protein